MILHSLLIWTKVVKTTKNSTNIIQLVGKAVRMLCILSIIIGISFSVIAIFALKINRTPPNPKKVEQILVENYDDIDTVVNYMCKSQYANIYIREDNGTMLADLEHVNIDDTDVRTALANLLTKNEDMYFSKRGNSILICVWSSFQNINSCIGCTTDHTGIPQAQNPTKIVPLSVQGWYYIIEDYNKTGDGSKPLKKS